MSRLSRLPQYLRIRNSDPIVEGSDEIESLEPNLINLTAALLDKLNSTSNYQNDWSNIEEYLPEFKLDEVLGGLNGIFDVYDPKMLKGFVRSKGTRSDVDYVTKGLGINLSIKEADEYYLSTSIVKYLSYYYPDLYPSFIYDLSDEDILPLFGMLVWYADNVNPYKANNVTPRKAVNFNRSSYSVLVTLGVDPPSEAQVAALDEALVKYIESSKLNPDAIDCSLLVEVSYDIDRPGFDAKVLEQLNTLMRIVVANRLLPHVRLRGISVILKMVDKYVSRSRISDPIFTVGQVDTDVEIYQPSYTENLRISSDVDTSPTDSYNQETADPVSTSLVKMNPAKSSYQYLKVGATMIRTDDPTRSYNGYVGNKLQLRAEIII